MQHKSKIIALLCLTCTLLVFGRAWRPKLSLKRYRQLNTFQRAQYKRAMKMYNKEKYRPAANEFAKFNIQFSKSPIASYALFMQAYCFHLAKDRNRAIKKYNEVMDYYGDKVQDASAALYWMGIAHIQNGQTAKGLKAFKELVRDKDYQKHKLAAGAARRLADYYWKHNQHSQAVRYYKITVERYADQNKREAQAARSRVIFWYMKNGNYRALEGWLTPLEGKDQAHLVNLVWHVAYHGVRRGRHKKSRLQKNKKAFWEWFKSKKKHYAEDKLWDYHLKAVRFLARHASGQATAEAVNSASQYIEKAKSKQEKDKKYAQLTELLRRDRRYERALHMASKISDKSLAAWKAYEIHTRRRKYKEAADVLLALQKHGDNAWKMKAQKALAQTYERMGKYEEAIKLYFQIAKPPWTLWRIQNCYYRWGKFKKAITTLTEIENSFPDEASKAAWQKAYYYQREKKKKLAIAQARRILKLYPKSRASSRAHQLLEKYGIATGGGVIDD